MGHKLLLQNIGPLKKCEVDIDHLIILTGPQSSGKSTVAKAVYFFRTVKQDILHIMMQGGPKAASGRADATWDQVLQQHMRDKFLQLFGPSWTMPDDMELKYFYSGKMSIRVFLKPNPNSPEQNFISFSFSDDFQYYLSDLDQRVFSNISSTVKKSEELRLSEKMDDFYETVFIPAGRNLITLLSTQLNYIFTSLENSQLRNIDYITKRYTELILKLKPSFENGLSGLVDLAENDSEQYKHYQKHKSTIHLLEKRIQEVLNGYYRYVDGEERLYLDQRNYVKINFASSGQQEIVWVFNLLFYYLLEDRKIFLILEEPESHLYPESQRVLSEILALFFHEENAGLITTHSPYVLGTFNYLLFAAQSGRGAEAVKRKIHERYWVDPKTTSAYHIHDGIMEDALDPSDHLTLIDNSLIDGASDQVNAMNDFIIEHLSGAEAAEA